MDNVQKISATQNIPLIPHEWVEREQYRSASNYPDIWNLLDQVTDPEIPVLSLWDMGILQDVDLHNNAVVVTITPTYSGCPAMDVIGDDIKAALNQGGYKQVTVVSRLAPAWTTAWMTPDAQKRLRDYGIAPPDDMSTGACRLHEIAAANTLSVQCPQCGSRDARLLSEFGSTSCKALMQCNGCAEAFDYFKRI